MDEIAGNLEGALKADPGFMARVKDLDFAKAVYSAFCNREWINGEGKRWSCSWRYAGGLVAEARGEGEDYLDFYLGDFAGEGGVPLDGPRLEAEFREILKRLGWAEITPEQEAEARLDAEARLLAAEALEGADMPDWYARFVNGKPPAGRDGTFVGRIHRAAATGRLGQKLYWKLLETAFLSEEAEALVKGRTEKAAG